MPTKSNNIALRCLLAAGILGGIGTLGWLFLAPRSGSVPVSVPGSKTANLQRHGGALDVNTYLKMDVPASKGEPTATLSNKLPLVVAVKPAAGLERPDEESELPKLGARALDGPPPGYSANPLHDNIRPLGLRNMVNTCYFNSIMQCIAASYHLLGFENEGFECFPDFKNVNTVWRQLRGLDPPPDSTGVIVPTSALAVLRRVTVEDDIRTPGTQADAVLAFTNLIEAIVSRCSSLLRSNEMRLVPLLILACQECEKMRIRIVVDDESSLLNLKFCEKRGHLPEPLDMQGARAIAKQKHSEYDHAEVRQLLARIASTPNYATAFPRDDPILLKYFNKPEFQFECKDFIQQSDQTLPGMLNYYFSAEDLLFSWCLSPDGRKLERVEGLRCDFCNGESGFRIQGVQKWPVVLVMGLGRFKYDRVTSLSGRINEAVAIPEYLEPTPGKTYRFLAASLQSGSLAGGHYWAIVRYGNKFWKCDDDTVTATSFSEVQNSINTYVVFYELISSAS